MTEGESKPEVKPPALNLKSWEDLYNLITIAKGGNPQAQQTLNNFLNFRDNVERSNFPTVNQVRMAAYLKMASKVLYDDTAKNPFRIAYESLSSAFMALKSKKSDQFVDMTRQTPAVAELTTEPEKPRLRDRLFRRPRE